MSLRLDRVIAPAEVARHQRTRALELSDYRRLSRGLRCRAVLEIVTPGIEETYTLIFASARLPVTLRLVDGRTGDLLWWGTHEAERAEGGLPTGLLSLPFELVLAGSFAGDSADRLGSMADDAARRVLVTLPSLRTGVPN